VTLDEFEQSWWTFVRHWEAAGGADSPEADAMIDTLLGEGLAAGSGDRGVAPNDATSLACEIQVVRRSGALDEDVYRQAFPEVRAAVKNPVQHFCESGWHTLFNPSSDFDVWWYWVEHLDPRTDRVNPLLHHLLVGRRDGLSAMPPEIPERPATRLQSAGGVRRLCLFAGYDPDGLVDDYVIDYVTELSRHADVYYLADSTMAPQELAKLESVTKGAWSIRHGLYDFGSWSMLTRDLVGWDTVASYDEVLFVNDSAYLLRPLDEVFARMVETPCDWWGLHPTKRPYARDTGCTTPLPLSEVTRRWARTNDISPVDHLHLSSYFLVFRRPVVVDPGFRRRIDSIDRQPTKPRVILKYEIGLSRYLLTHGFSVGAVIDDLYPYLPVYTSDYWELLKRGFPLLKRNLLSDNPRRMPDLADWKERIADLVPDAPLDRFERNLVRVTGDDQRRRSFSIRSQTDGTVDYASPLTWGRFRVEDRWAPKFDHWWAFPVCAFDHTLAGNERAVFEAVADDPSIKKIVLTRSRAVRVTGENVVVVSLMSREGQYLLARARQIFVKHGPNVNAYWPISPITHNFINLWHGIPLKRFGSASVEVTPSLEKSLRRNNAACRAVVTSSRVDRLAMTTAFWPLSYPDMWNTGLPRNDFISCAAERLPADLRATEERLRAEVAGRRLVMFLPTFKDDQADGYYRFSPAELERLAAWLRQHDAVLGVREHMADKARTYWHQLAPLGSIDLSNRRFPDLEILYRVADGLISDYSSCLIDFLLTGRPVASFAYDLDRYAQRERGLFYELEKVLPGPVCRTFDELADALAGFFEVPTPEAADEYAWRRRIFFDQVDDQASRRVVDRVKALYTHRATTST
jgi:CDP-glycerol glycerophosphotransferase (TagB/SpsB family)